MASAKRKLDIVGDHARTRELNAKEKRLFKGRPRMVARVSKKKLMPVYSAAMTVANLLYPKNFPEMIASKRGKSGMARTTYANRVFIGREDQANIETYYTTKNEKFKESMKELDPGAKKLCDKIFLESGIHLNRKKMNVGRIANRDLVSFEVAFVKIPRLRDFIKRMPFGIKRKQATRLLKVIEEYANENPDLVDKYGQIMTHS
ncbi:MAG: hypothetical protein ABID38_05005 [Candidatus Diapherotrites archaeon]